ncbi:MAG TPA: glycoside hydrolase family 127 protein [Anaerohalosphaeraceae bacterium]|nr:glycoside hydrolase family 127 protein [Anaerohalosphaeraceae bacterium]
MKMMHVGLLFSIGLLGAIAIPCGAAEETSRKEINLAIAAVPSSSYVSGDTSLDALNDGVQPLNSRDRRQGAYGNWNRTGTQWVQYEWSQPIWTNKIDVYWWDDRQGVRLPKACRLLYWDGEQFVPVKNAVGLGTAGNQFNTTTFDEVQTAKLRLEIDSDGNYSTGILEWKVYDSGRSPAFAPRVYAGPDRSVILGGKTYLSGTVRTLDGSDAPVRWNKADGPGDVVFADASKADTTAVFSKTGDYMLSLTAGTEPLTASAVLRVKVLPPPPKKALQPVDTQRYTIHNPLWNSRAKALLVNWIPHCIRKISDPQLKEGGINNFIEAAKKLAGQEHGPHRGYVFSNAWVYNTIESICIGLQIDPQGDADILAAQKMMQETLEDWIPKILAAQEPDGYLQTAYTLSNRQRWSPQHRGDHEGYVAGYFLDCAIAHYQMTGRKDARLYEAAKKLADCWERAIGPAPKQEWYDGHQAMEMALVRLGRFVNECEGRGKGDKYIRLAKFLLDCRGGGSEYDQSHLPVIRQYEAVGHAVRAVYCYTGMADAALELGDIDYQSAVFSLWDNIVNRKYYVTGGIGSGETSEGFGPDYSLPHNGYCESCSSCGLIYFQHRMNRMTRNALYADLYEETLYNALLGSIDLEGKNFYYQNPLESQGRRYAWHGCPCCVGNIPRTLLMLPTWMYGKDSDAVYVNLFVGSTVKLEGIAGTDVQLIQKTEYPWNGNVQLIVNPAQEAAFGIYIRVPNRSVSELYTSTPAADGIARLTVNGQTVQPTVENGYAVLQRNWKAGDRIELTLPMQIQRVKGIDKIEATRGRAALRYGPLIYCCERVDQPLDKVLAADAALQTEWRGDFLQGVLVIKGTWNDGSELLAIPYYARDNRFADEPGRRGGRGPASCVWLKDR